MSRKIGNLTLLSIIILCLGDSALALTNASITVSGGEQPGDGNTITVSFNGFVETLHYGRYSTPSSIASAFGAMFSRDYLQNGLHAKASGSTISFILEGAAPFGILNVTGSATAFQLISTGFTSQISQTGSVPYVGSISPSAAAPGTAIVISGAGFGAAQSGSMISLSGVTVTPLSWSNQAITAMVPPSAVSGPLNVIVGGLASNNVDFTVLPPTLLNWSVPAPINNGTALSTAQLDATSSVPGTFSYSPGIGTVLPVGTQTLTVTFDPTNTSAYQPVTASVDLVVLPAVHVAISPASVKLIPGQSQRFTATVTNSSNQFVTWSLGPGQPGTVDQTGLYTAPSQLSDAVTVAIIATSQADPTAFAVADAGDQPTYNNGVSAALWSDNSPAYPASTVDIHLELNPAWFEDAATELEGLPSPTGTVTFFDGQTQLGTVAVNVITPAGVNNETNLLSASENISPTSGSIWYASNADANQSGENQYGQTTEAVAAPDGSTRAQEITATGDTVMMQVVEDPGTNNVPPGPYTSSIWLRSSNPNQCSGLQLGAWGADGDAFGGDAEPVSIGTTWQRYAGGGQTTINDVGVYFSLYIPDGCTVDMWGAQLENDSSMSEYQFESNDGFYGLTISDAILTTSALSSGTHAIRAVYSGDPIYAGGTANFTQYVGTTSTVSTFDSGTMTLTINNMSATYNWGQGSSASSIAAGLASAISGQSGLPVAVSSFYNIIELAPLSGTTYFTYSIIPTYDTADFSAPSFYGLGPNNLPMGSFGSQTTPSTVLYQYNVGAYSPTGDLLSYTDTVMGSWNFGYDNLDRLVTAAATSASQPANSQPNEYFCWSYDAWGNRLQQAMSSDTAFTSTSGDCTTTGTLNQNTWALYDTSNHITQTNAPGYVLTNTAQTPIYDEGGDVTNDGRNKYLYDAEGRICAVSSDIGGLFGYVYDAEGNRIAKGTITSWSCDPTQNGFQQTAGYVVDLQGQQLTEIAVSGTNTVWRHTNVWAGGKLIATYDAAGIHYHIEDPLGTRRMQVSSAGAVEVTYQSNPYGDNLDGTYAGNVGDPTEHHFTGKERDIESGNDYMFARYYNSATGRFLSPDWDAKSSDPVPYAKLDNPQSLNLYSYVYNNPMGKADADGHQPPEGEIEPEEIEEGREENALRPVEPLPAILPPPTPLQQAVQNIFWGGPVEKAIEANVNREMGEPPQLAAGKAAHKNEEVRPGEKPEVPTPSGTGRMDRYNADTAHIREIKPDNPRQEKAGEKQLERYKTEMENATGRKHTTELTKYKTKPLPKDTPP